jgi:hypothetical protein
MLNAYFVLFPLAPLRAATECPRLSPRQPLGLAIRTTYFLITHPFVIRVFRYFRHVTHDIPAFSEISLIAIGRRWP